MGSRRKERGSPCVLAGQGGLHGEGLECRPWPRLLLCPKPALLPTSPFLWLQGCEVVSVRTLGAKHSCLPAITMATHPDRRERRGRPLPLPGNAMLCQATLRDELSSHAALPPPPKTSLCPLPHHLLGRAQDLGFVDWEMVPLDSVFSGGGLFGLTGAWMRLKSSGWSKRGPSDHRTWHRNIYICVI